MRLIVDWGDKAKVEEFSKPSFVHYPASANISTASVFFPPVIPRAQR